jgi:hypothetical protein
MRYALYAVLVLVGVGGLLLGLTNIGAKNPADFIQAIWFLLIGTVALGSLGVVMAIEASSESQGKLLKQLVAFAQNAEKRAAIADGTWVEPPAKAAKK